MTPEHQGDFEQEIQRLFHKRLYLLFWVAIVFFPLFSVLDYVVVKNHFRLFFTIRIATALFFLILVGILSTPKWKRYPFPIAVTGLIFSGAAISIMVVKTGGYVSFYYVGMICLLVAFTSILPLNLYQSIGSCVLMNLTYIIPVLIFGQSGPGDGLIFFNNNFFFIFFMAVSVVKSYKDYESRREEFRLRKDLNYYAGNLELEVQRRIKKQEESELKYKELYENIMDSLVVMDTSGKVLIANPKFYQLIGEKKQTKQGLSFLDFVHPADLQNVRDVLLSKLPIQTEIKQFHFRIINNENHIFDIECSAKKLQKKDGIIGFQLVLRDVTVRKKLEKDLIGSFKTLKNTRAATIMGLAKLTEYRDHETGNHLERIQKYARLLAEELSKKPDFQNDISPKYVEDITLSSILHDIGKVGIPDSILLKPGRLTSDEFEIIKQHCRYGGDALKTVETKIDGESFLTLGREIAYFHHEKWDGTGYPSGKKNLQIPLSARIISVCDVYDALTSKRIYKEAYSHDTAVQIIQKKKGKHFDPRVIDVFIEKAHKFDRIRKQVNLFPTHKPATKSIKSWAKNS
ncbi:two component protein (transcriptional response regulator/sensory box) [Desulforapulum autotrophicum HRM2]|uniref:Two component protein (Transcriptional response regulator/sensory box) n=1 Tax=Desulforapulum autotrophicum (strain ATCC 43914 / DSM 3382 / VKM B-1955 / HRM2) TaxID=177437 RepID=C0QCR7_DESAH|nr:HD domain-containing phosphohydrolase [Desulforapulum autotrophicum]ACN15144.1 two component protein (transcriptional response regulator/sensory box) [Desulforapulum autotrophicum HRM2]